jgi:hypothetical protein
MVCQFKGSPTSREAPAYDSGLFSSSYTRSKASPPFRIAWIATDTSLSFNALATGAADLSITYHAYAEKIALRQGIADRCVYAWRDHFMLVGKNPSFGHTLAVKKA